MKKKKQLSKSNREIKQNNKKNSYLYCILYSNFKFSFSFFYMQEEYLNK